MNRSHENDTHKYYVMYNKFDAFFNIINQLTFLFISSVVVFCLSFGVELLVLTIVFRNKNCLLLFAVVGVFVVVAFRAHWFLFEWLIFMITNASQYRKYFEERERRHCNYFVVMRSTSHSFRLIRRAFYTWHRHNRL